MKEFDRITLINKLKEERKLAGLSPRLIASDSNIRKLDLLIFTEHFCNHEYGIKSGMHYRCLDCGDSLSEMFYENIYETDEDINLIRADYLKRLIKESADDAFSDIEDKYKLKLVRNNL